VEIDLLLQKFNNCIKHIIKLYNIKFCADMTINEVTYIGSFERDHQCPKPNRPEYAFIGRSNVGKSSLINMLCQKKDLAHTSKSPGKTQLMNFFDVDNSWYLVDLPGYGYAKVSKKRRGAWEQMIERYLVTRENLQCAFVLIDSRHELQKIDLEFISWLGERSIPFVIVFTKIDKVKASERESNVEKITNKLLESWHNLPATFVTSAEKSTGRDEILAFIDELNNKSF
jgi:GTP-binding protein